jgi:hypothetical protein
MHKSEIQQRSDTKIMLDIAIQEREEYIKLYTRLQNNVTVYVDRSNFELAALAQLIQQKDQNIETLKKSSEGYFVPPTPPVISGESQAKVDLEPKPVPQVVSSSPTIEKAVVNGVHGASVEGEDFSKLADSDHEGASQ